MMVDNTRVGDGVTVEAGKNVHNAALTLVDAADAPENGHMEDLRGHHNAPDKTVGIKRKADEIQCAFDAEEGPNTSKRQLLGLSFISTALKTLNALKNISKFMKWGRGEVEEVPAEDHQPSLQDEPVVHNDETALLEATTAAPTAEAEENQGMAETDIQHHPEPDTTLLVAVPSTSKPEPSIFRPASHYSPPIAKAVKVVKRSELKRQLKEQRAPVATTSRQPHSPSNTNTALSRNTKNVAATGKSRGSRLLTMAHDKAPLAIVSMALAPTTKTPRAAFGLDDVIITPPARAQQQKQGSEEEEEQVDGERQELGGEENQEGQEQVVATIPVALEPSPEPKTAVPTPVEEEEEEKQAQEEEEEASPEDQAVNLPQPQQVAIDTEKLDDAEAGIAPKVASGANECTISHAAAQPNPSSTGVSGSPLSLALWGASGEKATKETFDNEPEESHGTVHHAFVSVALAAMAGVAVNDDDAQVGDQDNAPSCPPADGAAVGAASAADIDQAVAMEIDAGEVEAAAGVDATPLPEVEPEEECLEAPAAEDDKGEEQPEAEEKDAAATAALVDVDGGHGNQFTPLPRLLPRWGISSGGGDSAATSPSSCSLLPLGLSGGRNPSYKISKPGVAAPAAANSPSVGPLRSNKKNNNNDSEDDDMNDGVASTHPIGVGLEECSGRRVRFVGVQEIDDEEERVDLQEQDGDGERETTVVCRPSIRPLPPPVCRPSSANGRTHLTGAQPRFGIGAFVRIPSNSTNGTVAAQQNIQEGVYVSSPPDNAGNATSAAAGTAGVGLTLDSSASPGGGGSTANNSVSTGNDADTSPPVQFNASIDQDTVTPLVITRRLQHSGTLMRRAAALLPPLLSHGVGGDSIPQLLREAFLNARLAEHWCRGESWARLDLSGIELVRDGDREAHLNAVIATLTGQRGDTAVQTALDQLQIEWDHLKCFRQKYVSPTTGETGTVATAAAPKSILKHASGVSPLSGTTAAAAAGVGADRTPPLERHFPGFEDILAAEIVPGSTSPLEWTINALAGGGGGGNGHTGQLTPGIVVRSRGIKMLATLHNQAATAATATGVNYTSPQNGMNISGTGQTTDAVGGVIGAVATRAATAAAAAFVAAEEQQQQRYSNPSTTQQQPAAHVAAVGRRRSSSSGTRRGASSRGHRLLQALQNAAGPHTNTTSGTGVAVANTNGAHTTTAAAAAARLIVDSSSAGGDGGTFMTGPMATSFITS